MTYEAASEDEEGDRRRDLLRASEPAERDPRRAREPRARREVARPSVRSVSTVPGATPLTRTPLPASLAGRGLREEPDGALRRVVAVIGPRRRRESGRRADRHDAARAARRHRPGAAWRMKKTPRTFTSISRSYSLRLDLDERALEGDAGVRDDRARAASPRPTRRPPSRTAVDVGHVERDRAGGETVGPMIEPAHSSAAASVEVGDDDVVARRSPERVRSRGRAHARRR